MYFAAFLFWITGIFSAVVSLLTPPGEDFRIVRTTFMTRKSKDYRPDDDERVEKEVEQPKDDFELEALHKDTNKPIIKNQNLNKPDDDDDQEGKAIIETLSTPILLIICRCHYYFLNTNNYLQVMTKVVHQD
jgi:hypothetical protein